MAKRIERQELIDIDGLRQALAEYKSDYAEFISNSKSLNSELLKSQQSITAELQKMRGQLGNDSGDAFQQQAVRAAVLADQLKTNKTATNALTAAEQQHSKVTESLVAQQERLLNQYASVQGNTTKDIQLRNRLAREMSALQTQLDRTAKSSKLAGDSAKEVTGQYNLLQRELTDARKELKLLDDAFDSNTGKINRNNLAAVALAGKINTASTALTAVDKNLSAYGRNVGNYQSAISGLSSGLQGLASGGVAGAVTGLTSNLGLLGIALGVAVTSASAAIDKMSQFEQIRGGLKGVTKDGEELGHTQEYLEATADRLGISYEKLANSYKGVKVGTRDTALEGRQADRIFSAFTNRLAEVKAPADKAERALEALSQMISKGNVQAEELRGQLGDAMPGAFKLFADAAGVSTQQLNKMLQNGEVLAVDILPKVADQLEKTFTGAATENVNQLAGATERLDNQTGLLLDTFNQTFGITTFYAKIKNGIADTLSGMREAIKSNEWGAFLGLFSLSSGGIAASLDRFKDIAAAAKPLNDFKALSAGQRDAKLKIIADENARLQKQVDALQRDTNANGGFVSVNPIAGTSSRTSDGAMTELKNRIQKNNDDLRKMRRINLELEKQDRKQAQVDERESDKKYHEERIAAVAKEGKEMTLAERNARIDALKNEVAVKQATVEKNPNGQLNNTFKRDIAYAKEFIVAIQSVNKELEKKDAKDAARSAKQSDRESKAQKAERDRLAAARLQDDLGTNRANTGRELETVEYSYRLGITSEADYINQRLIVQQDGILREQDLLKAAGKEKTDEYARTETELSKIATDYIQARNKLQDQAFKLALNATKDAINSDLSLTKGGLKGRLDELEAAYLKAESEITIAVTKRQITKNEGERRSSELQLRYIDDIANATLASADTDRQLIENHIADLQAQGKTEIEIAEAVKLKKEELAKAEEAARDAKAKRDVESAKVTAKTAEQIAEESQKKRDDITQKGAEVAIAAVSGYLSLVNSFRDQDIARLEKQKDYELSMAGDSAEAKANIEQKYAAKEKEIRRKQAIADKAAALFSIAINTAVAATKVVANPLLLALVIGLGAIEAAFVAAKPLPEFFKGTSDAPEGPALVGERGYELIESNQGGKSSYRLAAEKQIAYLNAHDRVYTHEESKRMLTVNTELAREVRSAPGGSQYVTPVVVSSGLNEDSMRRVMMETLGSQTIEQTTLQDGEMRKYIKKKLQHTQWLNQHFSLPKRTH